MYVCPKGHQSQAGDYCDECGAAIAGGRSNSSSSTAIPTPSGPAAIGFATTGSAAAGAGAKCPECDTPQAGRFCEVCGYDFIIAKLGGGTPKPAASTDKAPAAEPASTAKPAAALSSAGGPATVDRPATAAEPSSAARPAAAGEPSASAVGGPKIEATGSVEMAGNAETAPEAVLPDPDAGPLPRRTPADASWVLVVDADASYHARMQAQAEPDAEPIAFPPFVPPRRFVLSGTQALIGRQSRSRGIAPEIDLSGPPSDSAVSHAHALLLAGPDGSWAVVDLESANGTYVNDGSDPIPPNAPCQLSDGDRIHVGAWTTITLGHPS